MKTPEEIQLEKDAMRYRRLKQDFSVMSAHMDGNHSWTYRRSPSHLVGSTLDEAIDKLIEREKC